MNDAEIIEAIGKLGKNQKMCFESLCEHGSWPGGWYWDNYTNTERMMKAFVKRGLASYDPADRKYKPIPDAKRFHERTLALVRARVAAERSRFDAERHEEEQRSGKRYTDLQEQVDSRMERLAELARVDGTLDDPDVKEAFGALGIACDALRRKVRKIRAEALKAAEAEKG